MTVTKEFVLAVVMGLRALRDRAELTSRDPLASDDSAAGRMLRESIEASLQNADIMAGWVQRNYQLTSLEREDLHV